MKERNLKIIIALMSVALLGLIAVQYYWIMNAIRLEEKLFDYKVNDAMVKAAKRVSTDESAKYVIHKLTNPDENKVIIFNGDSLKTNRRGKIWKQKKVLEYKYENSDTNVVINIDSDTKDSHSVIIDMTPTDKNSRDERTERKILTSVQIDSLRSKKKRIINDVVDQILFLSENEEIDKRINAEKLNAILSEELRNNGIEAEYYFGVKSEKRDTIYFATAKNEIDELNNSQYKTILFPEEMYKPTDYLLLTFPNRTAYLVGSISSVLAVSALFILAIIFLYYKTVTMLLRQKKISEMKSDLINNISHEFKTPLSTIALASEALKEPLLSKDKLSSDKYVTMIEDENNRLQNMVESILNTALIEKGEYKLDKTEIDIHTLIEEAVERNKLQMESSGGTLQTIFVAKNPQIFADKLHVSNIINNILDNAIKYSSASPRIKIKTEDYKNGIIIFISDEGIGMDKHQQKRIFDTFYRVSTGDIQTTRGYGIGLSYVKKLVEAHGGEITVKSHLKKGTTFKIFLPDDSR